MSLSPDTAVIVDFAEYRERRAERARAAAVGPRRFLWGWPASGQMMLVDFPAPRYPYLRVGSPQSPGG